MVDRGIRPADWTFTTDLIDLEGNSQASFTYTGTAGQSAALDAGIYDVWSDQDCWVNVAAGPGFTLVTTTTGYLLRKNNTVPLIVRQGSKVSAIRDTVSGTLWMHRIG